MTPRPKKKFTMGLPQKGNTEEYIKNMGQPD